MARNKIEQNGLIWIDITHPTEKDTDYLKKKFNFHALDLKDCLSVTGTPKVDVYDQYLFIVFHFPIYNGKEKGIFSKELNIFIGPGYLITLQKREFRAIEGFLNYVEKNKEAREQFMSKGPGFLLYNLVGPLFKRSYHVVDKIWENVKEIEREIYSEETIDVVKELALERRHILNFRRIIEPQRFLMDTLVHLKRDFLGYQSEIYFDDIHDHIERIWMLLENYREIVRGLHDTNEALISHKMNETMKVLTMISVSLLPLTLIASIYGMNIPLPLSEHPSVLLGIIGLMLMFIITTIIYFRRKKLL